MLKRIVLATVLALSLNGAQAVEAQGAPAIEIYGPVGCLACMEYLYHLNQNGIAATFKAMDDMAAVKRRLRVPATVESVLTAKVGGYFIEGHVPADDIKLLLREKPKARFWWSTQKGSGTPTWTRPISTKSSSHTSRRGVSSSACR